MPEGAESIPVVADAVSAGASIPVVSAPSVPPALLPGPTWKELQEFINKQTDRDRDLIDKWFKLAASIIGAVFVVATLVLGLVGWKTISDAKATADEAARAAAKAKIAEVLQEQSVKKLVEETAAELFKNGAYRQLIQQQTQSQLRGMHLSARLLDANAATAAVPTIPAV